MNQPKQLKVNVKSSNSLFAMKWHRKTEAYSLCGPGSVYSVPIWNWVQLDRLWLPPFLHDES